MSLITNLQAKAKAAFNNVVVSTSTDKIKWIPIEKIVIDPELKGIFKQEEKEIVNIAEDMKVNGYNPANPITLSQYNINVDGHTRYLAAKRAGLTKVAVIYKHFDSRQEMLSYAYGQQLNRRNLSDSELFMSYQKLKALTDENGKKAKTDVEIAEQLQISPRQVAKMKEVEKKASPETMEKIKAGETTVNKVYNEIKALEKPELEKKEEKAVQPKKSLTEVTEKKVSPKQDLENLCLKIKRKDFVLIQKAAEKEKLSVTEYAAKILINIASGK